MRVKFTIKLQGFVHEFEKEIELPEGFNHEGYQLKNHMHSITDKFRDELCEATFEILDGKYQGVHTYTDLYEEV